MDQITLRVAGNAEFGLPLTPGMHGIGRTAGGTIGWVDEGAPASVRFCVDRRGVWLSVGEGEPNVHVNGRPVKRMAMLRMGDTVHADGAEIILAGTPAAPPPAKQGRLPEGGYDDPRVVLRGVGGHYHGRSFTLDRPRLVGSGAGSDIRIDDPAFAERHCRIAQEDGLLVLRDLGSGEGSIVNGTPVRDALLRPGDQIVFDAHQRFVVESPGSASANAAVRPEAGPGPGAAADEAVASRARPLRSGTRRLPWLLLAAVLIAASLSALLLFGASG